MDILTRSALLIPALILPLCLFGDEKTGASADIWGLKSSLSFEPNRGQTDPAVRYLARTGGSMVFFTDSELVLHRPGKQRAVRFRLLGSSSQAHWEPEQAAGATTSYYIGRDPKNWAENVPRYHQLFRRDVYPGTDLMYYGNADRLEYDFVLAPHADPSRIRMQVDGANGISIAREGTLVIETPDGRIEQHKPVLYETLQDGSKRAIQGGFRMVSKDIVAFVVAKHDRNLALSIDPVLESASYFGGSSDDRVVLTDGNTTVGTTNSIDFPGATFARRQGVDIFVTGFFGFQSSTIVIGGSGDDQVTSAAFGGGQGFNPSIVVGGYTNSKDLPTNLSQNGTSGLPQIVWQTDFAGGSTDGFLLVLNIFNSRLSTFLTYVGTPGDDRVTAVAATTSNVFAVAGSTNGSGLPTSAFAIGTPFQPAPAGGLDGFFLSGTLSSTFVATNGFAYSGPSIVAASYFGGAGDDVPLAAAIAPITGLNPLTYEFYLAGETRSPNFPLVNPLFSQRSGDSDAFLMHIAVAGTTATLSSSTLFGGSGLDRGVALARMGSGNVALAGVTSSTDLPLLNPAQSAYGGGTSDTFFAQFSVDLSQLVSSTYFGGSGGDEATSAGADSFGNLFVAGWTASQDLPVQNALQSSFGGGPDDGFLLQFDIDGTVHQATYFGGSGSDRILGLVASGGPTVWLGGQTTSPDLPLKNPQQNVLKGPSDGFIAQISSSIFDLAPISGGKDLRVFAALAAGNAPTVASLLAQFTITSSDPSKVLVAANPSDLGQASVQVPLVASGYFYVDCLVDQGGADVTVSGAGYPSRTVRASCFTPMAGLRAASNPLRTQLWAAALDIFPYIYVTDPTHAAPIVISFARPGTNGVSVQLVSSNPSVVTVSPPTLNLPEDGNAFPFKPVGVGETDLQIATSTGKSNPYDHVHVSVLPPVSAGPDLPLAAGFETRLPISYERPPDPNATITITSQDPTRVALSLDPSQTGSGSVSFSAGNGLSFNGGPFVQALASDGDVQVTASVAGIDAVSTATMHLGPPVALLLPQSAFTVPLPLTAGGTASLSAGISTPGSSRLFFGLPNPGSPPLRFSLESSNPLVVAPVASSMDLSVNSATVLFQVRGIAEGGANLNLHPPDGIPLSDGYAPIPVVVKAKPVAVADLELGKDLSGLMTLTLPAAAASPVAVKLASSNPSLALLSPDTTSAGQPQISLTIPAGSTAARFYVYGFAAAGQARITADVAGYGSISANVTLEPSGFAWSTEHLTFALYTAAPTSAVAGVFVLDAASLIPVGAQNLRPGISASLNVTNSNPDVVSATPAVFTFSPFVNTVQMAGKAAGDAVLTLNQPPGFSSPSAFTLLRVTITTPTLQLSDTTLAKDTQSTLQLSAFTSGGLPLTVTSGDASRLLVSADPNAAGSASVTVPQLAGHPIYLQALDKQGSIIITASMPGYNDGAAVVHFAFPGVGMSVDESTSTPAPPLPNTYLTTTQSPPTRITLSLFMVDPVSGRNIGIAGSLRPGASPLQVEVRSSNATAGTIVGSPALFSIPSGNGAQPSVTFQPAGIGTTDVSVIQPPGFVAPAGMTKAILNVSAPGFVANDVTLGKDTFGQAFVSLPMNVNSPATNVVVTITSPDPTRALLSPDQDTPPVPSITRILVAGQRTISLYIHALGNSGVVPLTITAPGYMDSAMRVLLTDTLFYFGANLNIDQTIHAVIQNGPQILRLYATAATTSNGTFLSQASIRPGVNVLITVNSSDPSIVRIVNAHVVFQGGTSSQQVFYQPINPGLATLSLSPEPGYLTHPTQGQVVINAQGAKLSFNLFSNPLVGRDLQIVALLSSEDNFQQQPAVTITSSDPSRMLVSTSATAPGQASVIIPAASGQPQIFLQSLADNGTATLSASANGYQSGTMTLTLAPAAAVFQTGFTQQTISTNSPVQTLSTVLAPLDPATLRPVGQQIPRPGANLSIAVTSSDPKVLIVDTPTLKFPVDSQQQTVQVRPTGPGTAILSLGALPGGVMPGSSSQIVFNVAEPDLFIPNFSVGRDLQVPVQVTLGSRLPTPTSDVTINVSEFGSINLSTDPALFNGSQTIPVVIPAGQRVSRPFYVQGAFPSVTNLSISGTGYNTSLALVTVTSTAFVFQEANQTQPISIANGATTTLNVVPVLSPLGTPPSAPMTIRAGAQPIIVNVTSSNPAVLGVSTPQITLRPGDQRAAVTVRASAPGSATLTLSGAPAYDFGTVQSSIAVSVK